MPLIIFFAALCLVVILLVTAATSLYLERKRLYTLADGAALAAAESFDLSDVTVTDARLHAELTDDGVRDAVRAYLHDNPIGHFDDLAVAGAGTDDGQSASVTLGASWKPPVVSLLVPDGIRLEVTSRARSVFW
ncbi:pilus assembly protein TadG-related protein [Microbacterium sp. STN6]|uniref:pilus assembly protein TadG-related protein n=1 Tax=Microbacterium sp. STN6 TaxID=2995588 RepID=UPI00226091EB|nr:pilus assembly protein TadG-related protein [Microbacterium sp. STN6]MCX7522004.1 pilus assembly protein TadG-related protein [Microbacterium sp. STN6]